MALSKLENLYRHVILDHSSHPHNYGTLENADEQIELNNPTCGDVIRNAIGDGWRHDHCRQISGLAAASARPTA